MKLLLPIAAILLTASAPAYVPSVAEQGGDIVFTGRDGVARTLTRNGNNSEPVLSPDGRLVAYIHADVKAPTDETSLENDVTSLWIADLTTGATRRLVGPSVGRSYKQWMMSFATPIFSPDGRSIYVSALASEVSHGLHRVDVATGQDRYLIDGHAFGIVRSGPYRGHLLASRHKYWPLPRAGSYNPVDLISPAGKVVLTIPGTNRGGDEADLAVKQWLKRRGWTAS